MARQCIARVRGTPTQDASTLWTKRLRYKLNQRKGEYNDNRFWMAFNVFRKFSNISGITTTRSDMFISGFFVISSTNPIHSVFSLVLAFANTSCLLLMLGVEFLAFLFLIVYIGAIAILFLFVVMMLDIRLVEILDNATRYLPIGFLIGILFLIELTIIIDEKHFSNLFHSAPRCR